MSFIHKAQLEEIIEIPILVLTPNTLFVVLNLPFSVVDQMAGAATRAPERSPHGLHKI